MRVSIPPEIWGPSAWQFLEHCAAGLDAASAPSYRRLVELLPDVLPCAKCREHCRSYLASHPVDLERPVPWLQDFKASVSANKVEACLAPAASAAPPPATRSICRLVVLWLALLVLAALWWGAQEKRIF